MLSQSSLTFVYLENDFTLTNLPTNSISFELKFRCVMIGSYRTTVWCSLSSESLNLKLKHWLPRLHMSLLRRAEQCLINQKTYKALNAFIFLPKDVAHIYQEAQRADERHDRGEASWLRLCSWSQSNWYTDPSIDIARSSIDGQLIAVKDNICTSDQPTTCASKILKNFSSPNAATVVEKLKHAGAIVTGKTNLDEFGMGYVSRNSTWGHFGLIMSQFSFYQFILWIG